MHVNIGTAQFEYSNSEKCLGVHNDSELGFDNQINAKCGKARGKISALGRVVFFDYWQMEINYECLFHFWIQLNCPLIWIFHSRALSNYPLATWKMSPNSEQWQ